MRTSLRNFFTALFCLVCLLSAASALSINAEVRSFNQLGSGLVSSGFPVRPGDVTEADILNNKFCVFVNNVEQPTYLEVLHGRFQDGSVRSVLIQFPYTIPDSNPIVAEVRVGTTCTASHLAKTPINNAVIVAARTILPSDKNYLVDTWVTFQPLITDTQEDPVSNAYFTVNLDRQFEATWPYSRPVTVGKYAELYNGTYKSSYESARSLFAAWQKTGDTKYFYNGYIRAYSFLLNYSLPPQGHLDPSGAVHYRPDPNVNNLPSSISHVGLPNEANSQRYVSYGSAYLLTGAEEYWNVISISASAKLGGYATKAAATTSVSGVSVGSGWIDGSYIGRSNLIYAWSALLTVPLDATKPFSTGGNGYGGRSAFTNYDQRIPWILDAWEMERFTVPDHRQGFVGSNQDARNGGPTNPSYTGPGYVPHFQAALLCDYLIFYYENVHADPRIPIWVKNMTDIMLTDVELLQVGDKGYNSATWGYAYEMQANTGAGAPQPWTLPMWSNAIAFTYAQTQDPTYLTWYNRFADAKNVDPSHLGWDWKIWGESYGNVMSAPYYINRGKTANPPAYIRIPIPSTVPVITSGGGTCTPTAWTPDATSLCGTVTQTDGCGHTQQVTGGVTCLPTHTCVAGTCVAPDVSAPSTVSGLSATATSAYQINLVWSAATDNIGVTGYRVFRNGIAIVNITQPSYNDAGLTPQTAYTYTVLAYDAAGNNGSQSSSASATTQAAPASGTLPSGIIAKYEFTSGLAQDTSGNNFHGTLVNGPVQAAGKYGDGLLLDGINDYVQMGSPAGLDDKSPATYSAWIKPNSGLGHIFGKRDGTCTGYWRLGNPQAPVWINVRGANVPTTATVPMNSWTHVAVTWDGSASTSSTKIYINGAAATGTVSPNTGGSDAACNFTIGTRNGLVEFYNGTIDELRIYNRVLAPAEILIDMNTAGSGGVTCTPESDTTFCARLSATCGSKTGTDNCGATRTVNNCGICTSGYTCTNNACIQNQQQPEDRNADGTINVQDIILVAADIKTQNLASDLNNDGTVDIRDLVMVARAI